MTAEPQSRRRPVRTEGTLPPEGSAAALGRDHALPVRQWPITLVLVIAGIGLAIAALGDTSALKVGLLIVGVAPLIGAVLRLLLPEVGMLAVRSRFTDVSVLTFLGGVVVLLAVLAQPDPWLHPAVLDKISRLIARH